MNVKLETERQAKTISSNLSARVELTFDERAFECLAAHRDFLPTLFGVSEVAVSPPGEGAATNDADEGSRLTVRVTRAGGVKCERCWRYVPAVRTEPDWAGICDRCVEALAEPVSR